MLLPLYHGHVAGIEEIVVGLLLVSALGTVGAAKRLVETAVGLVERETDEDEHVDATAREQYVAGDITLEEYERRIEAAMDPSTSRALEVLDEADGIGEARALDLAEAFGSVETLAAHDPDEVAAEVDGIGEVYAERAVETAEEAAE